MLSGGEAVTCLLSDDAPGLEPYSVPVLSLWRGVINPPSSRVSMPEIAQRVAHAYGLTVPQVRAKYGPRAHAPAQQHAVWLMHKQAHLSFPMIGAYMGGRDYSSMIYARDRHERRIADGAVAVEVAE